MSREQIVANLYRSINLAPHTLGDDTARLTIHQNQVVGAHLVPGLVVEPTERADGVTVLIRVQRGMRIEKPVHLCFGVLPDRGRQHIILDVTMEENAGASIFAHCTFPNAVEVRHEMDARIVVGQGANYSYMERHVHGPQGGVLVLPRAKVTVLDDARFKTDFVLISGRVGKLEIDYAVEIQARAVMELTARVSGRGNDEIKINESGRLVGESARGVLTSYIAVREDARAHVHNTLTATAPYARGHVDCKEIVQDRAVATAVPVVEVLNPKAHVTHEAAIGSVDSKQLQTLMSRGLTEEKAVDLIIQGLLT
jgi:hypothetical protein